MSNEFPKFEEENQPESDFFSEKMKINREFFDLDSTARALGKLLEEGEISPEDKIADVLEKVKELREKFDI